MTTGHGAPDVSGETETSEDASRRDPPVPPSGEPALHGSLSALLRWVRQRTGIPGLTIAVHGPRYSVAVSLGRTAACGTVPLTPNARFQIGCMVKLLTATVAAQLARDGLLDIDAPVPEYLAELSRTWRARAIKVRHLLCHTSGYAGPGPSTAQGFGDPHLALDASWDRLVEFLDHTPQLFKPGTVFSYESTEYVLLGEIIRRVSGRDVVDHYQERVLQPLRIRAEPPSSTAEGVAVAGHRYCPSTRRWVALEPVEHNTFWRASLSDLTLSIGELCKLGRLLAAKPDDPVGPTISTFLTRSVVALPVISWGGNEGEMLPQSIGLGCAVYRGGLLGRNGSARGQSCGLRADPPSNTTVAVALNAHHPLLRDRILHAVVELLRGSTTPREREQRAPIDPSDLTGRYIGPQDTCVIVRRRGAQLLAEIITAGSDVTQSIVFDVDGDNRLTRNETSPPGMIGFFRDEHTESVGLMLAMTAYKKESV